MSVYIDDFYKTGITFRGMKMSHMMADSTAELLAMATTLKLNHDWLQYPGRGDEHFDVALGVRAKAIKAGAIAVGMRKLARAARERKSNNEPLNIKPENTTLF